MTGQQASPEDRHGDPGLDAETLLDDTEQFDAVLDSSEPGPLAVVGDPFAGREVVLDRAAERLDATRVALDPGDGVDRIRAAIADGPLVVDNCQHLYRRVVGGFEPVEALLRTLATAEVLIVTGWNRYAWSYLARVRELDQAFGTCVDVGEVATERLAELLLSRYDSVPEFTADEPTPEGVVTVTRSDVTLGGRTFSIPVPKLNLSARSPPQSDTAPEPRDVVFERLAATADGNVGVATALWDATRCDTVRPSDIGTQTVDLTLDRDETFCVRVLLAKERVERAELVDVIDDDVDRILGRLRRARLVSQSDGIVSLDPARVPAAVTSTDRSRIL